VFSEANEDQTLEDSNMNLLEAVFGDLEIFTHLARRAKATIQIIGPRMIGTDEDASISGILVADSRATMLAYVDEASYHVVPTANNDQRLLGKVESKPISTLRNAADVANAKPTSEVDSVDVSPKDRGIRVEFPGKRGSLGLTFDE